MNDDFVRRQDVIDAFDLPIYNIKGKENAEKVVEYLKEVIQRIKDLPSEQNERIGVWEEKIVEDENPFLRRRFYCSACGRWNTYGKPQYCPRCGARMEESNG